MRAGDERPPPVSIGNARDVASMIEVARLEREAELVTEVMAAWRSGDLDDVAPTELHETCRALAVLTDLSGEAKEYIEALERGGAR